MSILSGEDQQTSFAGRIVSRAFSESLREVYRTCATYNAPLRSTLCIGENKIRHFILLLTLIFPLSGFSHEKYPWAMTPIAQKEMKESSKTPLWTEVEGINIGYSESENIEKIKSDFKESYRNYQSTDPDIKNSRSMSMTMSETDITFFVKSFESQCRTFLEFSTKPSGTVNQNTGKEISQREICKMELLAFVLNGYTFKKSKRERTLVLEKSI